MNIIENINGVSFYLLFYCHNQNLLLVVGFLIVTSGEIIADICVTVWRKLVLVLGCGV